MLAPVVGAVVRGIVVDQLDVAHQSSARIRALDQVVAEQCIPREAMLQHPVQGVDLVDAFASEDAFAVEVLINVGDGSRVNVEAGLPGIDAGESRLGRTLHADADTGLKNTVTRSDNVA